MDNNKIIMKIQATKKTIVLSFKINIQFVNHNSGVKMNLLLLIKKEA